MKNKKKLFFFLTFILATSCSFDNKTGIWSSDEEEKVRVSELKKEQKNVININKVYFSEEIFSEKVALKQKITLSPPIRNKSWKTNSLNAQNFLGNIYLSGVNNVFLRKKIGKNKFNLSKVISSPLVFQDKIFYSDDTGTIFNITLDGKIIWKQNIYRKLYKGVYKNLSFSIYKEKLYIADNIGFIYAISLETGKLIWIKNHGIPLKSSIKIFEDKIYLINQDNRLISLRAKDGTNIWDIRAISSFIKSQNFLSLVVSKDGDVITISSSGDLLRVNGTNGNVYWSTNISGSLLEHATDFFKSSDIVLSDDDIIFSTDESLFSYNIYTGNQNWEKKANSASAPIVDGNKIFFVTINGHFVIMNKNDGKIVSSENILNLLKKKQKLTKIVGFIMGSGKIYSVTSNGFLIESSALSGKANFFKKIGDPIISTPIINNGSLYILTENSRIIGFN